MRTRPRRPSPTSFIQEAMTEFLRAPAGGLLHREQGRGRQRSPSRCSSTSAAARQAEKARLNIKKKLSGQHGHRQPRAEVRGLPHAATSRSARDIHRGGRLALWAPASSRRDAEFQGIMPVRGKILNCLKADYGQHLQKRDHHRPHEGPRLRRGGARQARQGAARLRSGRACAGARSSSAPTPTWTASRSAR